MTDRDTAQTPRTLLSQITRTALIRTIALYDELGEAAFFERLARQCKAANIRPVTRGRRFFVKVDGRLYHSKALISSACVHNSVGRPLGTKELSGGVARLSGEEAQ